MTQKPHFEDEGLAPELALVRQVARRSGQRAAQAAYRTAYRRALRLARAQTVLRALPGARPAGALGALTEAYHRWYDVAHPGVCNGRCPNAALRLLAFLPEPWRLTDSPDSRRRSSQTAHGLASELLVLLPAPWRLVADRSIPRPAVLDASTCERLLWGADRLFFWDFAAYGAPGEPADWAEARERALVALKLASASGRQPDLANEGPALSVRQFVLRLWAQARDEHRKSGVEDAFLSELRQQLVALRGNPYGGRKR